MAMLPIRNKYIYSCYGHNPPPPSLPYAESNSKDEKYVMRYLWIGTCYRNPTVGTLKRVGSTFHRPVEPPGPISLALEDTYSGRCIPYCAQGK